MPQARQSLLIALTLFSTYFIWGVTYLAIRFGIESFPPFLLAGLRFTLAGFILFIIASALGYRIPTWPQWRNCAIVGTMLPAFGNGTVCFVQQTISSSVAALSIATAPIWMAAFSSVWGHKITPKEWLGIAIGLIGIVLLNVGGSFNGELSSSFLLIFAAASWSFGSVWSKHLDLPRGLMAAATQMLIGGIILLTFSRLQGETWPTHISEKSYWALLFMVFFGSIVAYSAYQYLLNTVRPLVASSNTFVNPVVAFIAGAFFASERITHVEIIALSVILIGVFLVLTSTQSTTQSEIK